MSTIGYLLDENVDPVLRTAILDRSSEIVVWQVGQVGSPPLGTLDPDILLWCELNDFILVTNNRRSMPRHLSDHLDAGHFSNGIFTLNDRIGLRETVEELILIASASDIAEYRDTIFYLPILNL